jgi:RNA polymerase sigma-70 factor (ECF subfamily)
MPASSAPLPSDRDLILDWKVGADPCFDRLVHRHGPALLSFLRGGGADAAAAEDAWAEAFTRLFQRRATISADGSIRAWLFRTGRRCLLDGRRAGARLHRATSTLRLTTPVAAEPEGADRLESQQRSRALHDALGMLPDEHRRALLLRYRLELDTPEIGRLLGLGDQQVRDRLRWGRMMLNSRLGPDLARAG